MSYDATLNNTSNNQVNGMSLFKGISNVEVARILSATQDEAVRLAGKDMKPTLLAIAKGQPYTLPEREQPKRVGGSVSGFFSRLGL